MANRLAAVEVVLDVVGCAHGVGPVEIEHVRRAAQHRLEARMKKLAARDQVESRAACCALSIVELPFFWQEKSGYQLPTSQPAPLADWVLSFS